MQIEEGERINFANGDSTLFQVNQRERSTTEANVNIIALKLFQEKKRKSLI